MVYCIGNREQKICKIGYTQDVDKRLAGIQTGNPFPLSLFATVNGGSELEKKLHNKFMQQKMMGEWFTLTQEICDYFQFDFEPIPRLYSVALTYMQKDAWEVTYTNCLLSVFACSESEAVAKAKFKVKAKGNCVRSQAAMIPESRILEAAENIAKRALNND